ncbi:MAG: hypothetical protein ACKV2V_20690, partial [Blastocatellia bacterium]
QFYKNALDAVSANDSLHFTPRQFYYLLNERRAKAKDPLKKLGAVMLGIGGFLSIPLFITAIKTGLAWPLLLSMLTAIAGGVLLASPARRWLRQGKPRDLLITSFEFDGWLARWTSINGGLSRLLKAPALTARPARVSEELTAYSFDRAVICQHDTIAQFLIANNFHFEHNCAVLSLNKYPRNLFDTVMAMLRRNPSLSVYTLHDASVEGVRMTHQLTQDPEWFGGMPGVRFFDLGLTPRQVIGKAMYVRQDARATAGAIEQLPAAVRAGLDEKEIEWLRGQHCVELESILPQRLLQIITIGIARSRDPRAGDSLTTLDYTTDSYSSVHVYSSDSFG